jgi:hypothetical protein
MNAKFTILAVLIIVGALSFALVSKYRYYDYNDSVCSSSGINIELYMHGTFTQEKPTERSVPYYLLIDIPENKEELMVESAELVSIDTRKSHLFRGDDIKSASGNYVIQNLIIPYEDYEVSLKIKRQDGIDNNFKCTLKRKYSEEYRINFWDNLLSV